MTDQLLPFKEALDSADGFSNLLARSALLVELARAQVEAGLVEESLACIRRIPNQIEQKGVLLDLAIESIRRGRTESLLKITRQLIAVDPNAAHVVGRLALTLAESGGETGLLLDLLRTTKQPFDSDRNRYEFFDKFLAFGNADRLPEARRFLETFEDKDYRDWGVLALAKRSASLGAWPEAEEMAVWPELDRRRSWIFLELSRLAETKRRDKLLDRSVEILEAIPIGKENAETLAVQLRLTGKDLYRAGLADTGERVLERAEAAATSIPDKVQKIRARLFLARVLRRHGLVGSVRDYFDPTEIDSIGLGPTDRSRAFQWLAEAQGPPDDLSAWIEAIRSIREPAGSTDDFHRAERIAETVHRFACRDREPVPTDEPDRDAVILSGEEFESFYFSPFAIDDCGC